MIFVFCHRSLHFRRMHWIQTLDTALFHFINRAGRNLFSTPTGRSRIVY
jgi:hypothetical protein